ncbi:MAG: acyl-CoA dehydrogenase family protein [Candidatus Nitrosocaldus sp.]
MTLFRKELRDALSMLYSSSDAMQLLESLGDLMESKIMPNARRIDAERIFPRENLDMLFKHGLCRIPFPSRYGGLELPYPVYIASLEMLGMACASTGLSLAIHCTVCSGIEMFGSEEQKEHYLKPLIHGKMLGAFALTEPDAGSDAKAIQTRARLDEHNNSYIINGRKRFITNGGYADLYLVFAVTEKGYSAFLVDKDCNGLRIGKYMDKMGVRGSTLTELHLNDCIVPKANLLGEEGKGYDYAMEMLHTGRIGIAALSTGIAQIAFEKSLAYSKRRYAFGKPIAEFQMIRQKLADMHTAISAARHLTLSAAWAKDNGLDYALIAAEAKLFASETAKMVSDEAIQIHGAYGYVDEYDVNRHWRDARMMSIGEGTSEMMRLIISHRLLRSDVL